MKEKDVWVLSCYKDGINRRCYELLIIVLSWDVIRVLENWKHAQTQMYQAIGRVFILSKIIEIVYF
jgi:hypothetical protein